MTAEYNDYLAHHGIPGMKWGKRRYQYLDGTYTPEGKARYGIGEGLIGSRDTAVPSQKKPRLGSHTLVPTSQHRPPLASKQVASSKQAADDAKRAENTKKILKIAAGVALAAALAYGTYRGAKYIKMLGKSTPHMMNRPGLYSGIKNLGAGNTTKSLGTGIAGRLTEGNSALAIRKPSGPLTKVPPAGALSTKASGGALSTKASGGALSVGGNTALGQRPTLPNRRIADTDYAERIRNAKRALTPSDVRKAAAIGAAGVAGLTAAQIEANRRRRDRAAVEAYKDEHPNTKLTDNEILKRLRDY